MLVDATGARDGPAAGVGGRVNFAVKGFNLDSEASTTSFEACSILAVNEVFLQSTMASPAALGAAGGPGALEAGGGYVALGGEERQDSGSKSRYGSEFLRSVRCGACTKYRRATLGAWAGVFLVVAFVGPAVVDWRFRRGISTALDLSSPDGPSYAAWLSSDAGTVIAYDVYYFDVTNADAVAYAGARPVVVEKGPYAYREKYAKFDVDWRSGGKDVEYFERDWYEFDPSRSCDGCRETDTVTTADVVVASLGEAVDGLGAGDATTVAVAKYALKLVLCQGQGRSRASPFVTRAIKDLHFGRWDDPTLAALVTAVDAVPSPLRDKVPSFLTELTTYVPGFQTNYTSDDLTRRLCGAKDRVDAGVRKAGAKALRYGRYERRRLVVATPAPRVLPGGRPIN